MSSPTPDQPAPVRSVVARNAAITIGARIFYLASRFFLPPLILRQISLELYGVWATCFIVIGYFGMSAFGVSNVYIRYIAAYHVKGAWDEINRLLSTGIAVTVAVSTVLLGGLWWLLPSVVAALKISPEYQHTAVILIFGTAATFVLDLTLGAFGHVLTALQRISETTAIWMASVLLETVLIVAMLPHFGVYALLMAFVIRYIFVTVASILLCWRVLPHLQLRPKHFDRATLGLFYKYGGIVQLSGILGMFLYSVEKIVAGFFLGVWATGLFDLGEKFAVMGSQVASSVNGVILPAASQLHALDDRRRVTSLYLRASRYLSALSATISGFLPAFAIPLITVWVGADPRLASAAMILMLFALPFQCHVLTGPGSAIHRATDHPARELVYPLTQLTLVVLSVSAGFFLAGRTLQVVAIAVSGSMVVSQMIYMTYTNRMLGVPLGQYARRVLLPMVIPYSTAATIALLARAPLAAQQGSRIGLLLVLAMCGMVYAAATAAIFWKAADPDERVMLGSAAARYLGRVPLVARIAAGRKPGAVTPAVSPTTAPRS